MPEMKPRTNPYWYKLIKLLKQKEIITTGLTIPYIYGAYKVLNCPFANISDLINEVLNLPIDKYPVIQKCNLIHQHVTMVEEKEICNKQYIKDVKLVNTSNNNYLFISTNTDLGKTVEKLSFNLTALYGTHIRNENFSWNNLKKEWQKFSESEIGLIKSIE